MRARIHTINGFSAHADQARASRLAPRAGGPTRTFLVHGEEKTMRTFAGLLKDTEVVMPKAGEGFAL